MWKIECKKTKIDYSKTNTRLKEKKRSMITARTQKKDEKEMRAHTSQ